MLDRIETLGNGNGSRPFPNTLCQTPPIQTMYGTKYYGKNLNFISGMRERQMYLRQYLDRQRIGV